MISFLICVAGAGTLAIAALALLVALEAKASAEQALEEHGYTLDAADELFEDHEARINELELGTTAKEYVQAGNVSGGGINRV